MLTMPNFVSMKKTPEDIAEDKADMCVPGSYPQDLYPWGLAISLDEECLSKLDLDGTPDVGDSVLMMCVAKVTSASKRETDEGVKSRIELQITDIAIEDSEEEEPVSAPRKPAYGKMYKE